MDTLSTTDTLHIQIYPTHTHTHTHTHTPHFKDKKGI